MLREKYVPGWRHYWCLQDTYVIRLVFRNPKCVQNESHSDVIMSKRCCDVIIHCVHWSIVFHPVQTAIISDYPYIYNIVALLLTTYTWVKLSRISAAQNLGKITTTITQVQLERKNLSAQNICEENRDLYKILSLNFSLVNVNFFFLKSSLISLVTWSSSLTLLSSSIVILFSCFL